MSRFRASELLPLFLFLAAMLGVLLRLVQYLENRSLWIDESFLAISIVERPISGLLAPLEYNQVAPLGFLVSVKLAVTAFGESEQALRLAPLLGGMGAVFVFMAIARRHLSKSGALLAVALFALSPSLVYYSSEVKQYSTDVFFAVALVGLASAMFHQHRLFKPLMAFSAVGAVAVWFSHPAVFILAGASVAILLWLISRGDQHNIRLLLFSGIPWTFSFVVSYLLARQSLIQSTRSVMGKAWEPGFMPLLPNSLSELAWFPRTFFLFFSDPLGVGIGRPGISAMRSALPASISAVPDAVIGAGVAPVIFVVGAIALWHRHRYLFLLLFIPAVLNLFASGLRLYPFHDRVILYLAPAAFLAIGEGGGWLLARARGMAARLVVTGLIVILVLPAAIQTGEARFGLHELRPALMALATGRRVGDTVYVTYGALPALRYYARQYNLDLTGVVVGQRARGHPEVYFREIDRFKGDSRVWIVFTHNWVASGINEEELIFGYVDSIGQRVTCDVHPGARVCLYDLS